MNQTAQKHLDDNPAANVGGHERGRPRERADFEELDDLDVGLGDEDDIGRATIRVLSRLRERIREQPLTSAAGALIIGFALGNGVPKFLARAGVGIGLRFVMGRMLERALMAEEDDL